MLARGWGVPRGGYTQLPCRWRFPVRYPVALAGTRPGSQLPLPRVGLFLFPISPGPFQIKGQAAGFGTQAFFWGSATWRDVADIHVA